ncbi:MAG: sulfurtransferase TusA family protein [Nitrospirae bacterium]|nr:sulfurtransferase TusA family protein [Nitrospirota bacterium]
MPAYSVLCLREGCLLVRISVQPGAVSHQDYREGERRGGEREGDTTVTGQPDTELDLRGVICPYNFVKTKLKLEAMEQGQILSVLLDDGDPIRNVPRSVSNEGHTVLSQDRVEGSYRVLIRRREDE